MRYPGPCVRQSFAKGTFSPWFSLHLLTSMRRGELLMIRSACAVLKVLSVIAFVCTTQAFAQYVFPSFPNPTINTGVHVINGGGPALVPLANGLYTNALELIYVDTLQDVSLAYSTDGLHYTNVGYINPPPGGVAELDCTPAYADHCGVAAVAYNGELYVAYNDYSCNCLHVLQGTSDPGYATFTWTDVYNDTAHQLTTTPTMLVTTDNPTHPNLIIRYGTTVSGNNAYSSVFNGSTNTWSTQASNGVSPTQSTLFAINGANYAIDKSSGSSTQVNITQLDDNGVAIPGTTYALQDDYATLGFSSVVYNNDEWTVFVASRPQSSNELQLLSSSAYYDFADGVNWGSQTYPNNVLVPYDGSYPGDFAMTVYPPQPSGSAKIVVAYSGDSNGDLYATSGTVPVF